MKSVLLSTLRYTVAVAALVAAYYSAIFARASFLFEQDTATSIPAAVDLVPYNGSYVARLAAWQPGDKETLLHRAVQLNPFDYQTWIQLGLTAEMQQHDLLSAERYYLRAAEVNHMFLPKWTLSNFYFRNEQPEMFFHWAKATLQISPYHADPVFAQMWLMSQNPSLIASALPDKPSILLEYTNFLMRTRQFAPVPPVIQRLVSTTRGRNPSDVGRDDQILPAEDRLLAEGQLNPALTVWQTLSKAGWIGLQSPTPAAPLTNGDFARTFLGHGFDWVASVPPGVNIEQSASGKRVDIALSGDQPEHCRLLQQYLPLRPNRTYHLQWQAENHGLELPAGIVWRLHPLQPDVAGHLLARDVLTGDLRPGPLATWDFQSPPASDVCLLTLEYSRPLGKLRSNGSLTLRSVFLQEK